MTTKNRFSYNLAVSDANTYEENEVFPNVSFNSHSEINKQILPRGSQKMHEKTSTGSSVNFREFEEEELSTINENLDWLLVGEVLVHRELNIGFRKQEKPERTVYGRVYVTNYRLRFEERIITNRKEQEPIKFDVTLGSVSKIDKIGYYNVKRNTNGLEEAPYGLNIICKDFRNIKLLHRRKLHGRRELYKHLRKYAFPNSNRQPFFATIYAEKFHHNGWTLFEVINEFKRQKIPSSKWQLSRINKDYEFARTYPALFYVPSDVFRENSPDEFLNYVSKFRSKQRIPVCVLSWIDSHSCAALIRSSQPLVGMSRKSISDENYLKMIINANPNSDDLIILDARPSINAKANRANGGGYENYPQCHLKFMDIQNIHVVRESLRKLKDACFPYIRQKYFQSTLEETKWLLHLQTILEAAALAAREISVNKNSVLVHCSDGWDRTAQIVSLAMLQLDPYYRTIEGFAVLIEKEWCSFGHKFAQRIGHGQEKPEDKERSPIFVQFIDCVWQLFNQYTFAFQFNVRFLKTILDELYSCRFGTFLYNNECERNELGVKKIMTSLWSFVLDNQIYFINEKYKQQSTLNEFILQPSKIHPLFWTDYYCRYSLLIPSENEDQLSLTGSSIGPSTPLSVIPTQQMSLSTTKNITSNNEHLINFYSTNDAYSNSSTPTCKRSSIHPPKIPPETPARQRRLLPSTISQQNNEIPTEANTSQAVFSSSSNCSSSTGSEYQTITRV